MKNLIITLLIVLSTGCASMELKQYKGKCRHDALFVASVLAERYPTPDTVFIEVSKSGNETHAQAFIKVAEKRIYFSPWHNRVWESTRDEQSGKIIKDYTLKEFFESNRHWRRY